jgi:vitamin B12 transporter
MAGGEWTHSFQMPEDKFVGTLYLFPVEKLKLTFTGRWESARKNEYGDIMDDAFFTVDMAASYDVTDHLQVYAKVNNLLDEDYAVYGWEMPGINAMAGVRYTF